MKTAISTFIIIISLSAYSQLSNTMFGLARTTNPAAVYIATMNPATGVATNVCIESTARDGYFREFWPILIEDAMDHTGPDFVRQGTLYNFESKMGWITQTDEVIKVLKFPSNSD